MTKHKENSKRASLDSVFWILFPGAFGGKMFTWLVDTNGDWALGIHHRWLRLGSRSPLHVG
jgi:hypothetical protein